MKDKSMIAENMTRVLSGEISESEKKVFFDSLAVDSEKRKIYEAMEREWITAENAILHKNIDLDVAWESHKNQLTDYSFSSGNYKISELLKWAAVLVLGVGISIYFLSHSTNTNEDFTFIDTGENEVLPITLSDGSIITLNENSRIDYRINSELREVKLIGEAYFDITPDKSRPFVVNMSSTYVKVLGTEFNINTEKSEVVVSVAEGTVEFGKLNQSEKRVLRKGHSALFENDQLRPISKSEKNNLAWYSKELEFDYSTLPEVLESIAKTYHVDFQYDSDLFSSCHLTASFNKEELPNILKTLKTIFDIDFITFEDQYLVKGSACNTD
ncbi:MAG: FecR domain-containing protein [Reichenbachiella sp.]